MDNDGRRSDPVSVGSDPYRKQGRCLGGDFIGIFSPETGDIGAELFAGTGDYEGLYYYQWVFGTLGQPWPTNGLIFPGTVPMHTVPTP